MAKDSSFDVVSEVDMQEVDNAYQQTLKELVQRYDLKDSGSSVELDKHAATFTVSAPSDFVLKQVIDVLNTKLIRRNIDIKAIQWGKHETASGGTVRVLGKLVSGIETELAKKIAKDIRDQKFKAKPQVEGEKVRVFSPSRDELQAVQQFLRDQEYEIPLQFNNYR